METGRVTKSCFRNIPVLHLGFSVLDIVICWMVTSVLLSVYAFDLHHLSNRRVDNCQYAYLWTFFLLGRHRLDLNSSRSLVWVTVCPSVNDISYSWCNSCNLILWVCRCVSQRLEMSKIWRAGLISTRRIPLRVLCTWTTVNRSIWCGSQNLPYESSSLNSMWLSLCSRVMLGRCQQLWLV